MPTTAVILAGGLGTRLRSVVADLQKVVAPVDGKPFVWRVLDDLEAQGVTRVVLCVGHRADTVRAAVEARSGRLELAWSVEREPLGTGGALANARALLPPHEPVLVMNGDSACEVDLAGMAAFHERVGASCTLALAPVADRRAYGGVEVDRAGRVHAFLEKQQDGPGWVNAGVLLAEAEVLVQLPSGGAFSLERDVYPRQAGLHGYRGARSLVDIGTPERWSGAARALARPSTGARRLVLLDRDGVINREVHHLSRPEDVELLPGTARAMRLLRELGLPIAVVTNQSPLGRGWFNEATLATIHERLRALLAEQGAAWDWIGWCPHTPEDGCACRKPAPGLARSASKALGVGLGGAFVVGDKACDLGMGRSVGATTILVRTGHGDREREPAVAAGLADHVCEDLWCAAVTIERLLAEVR